MDTKVRCDGGRAAFLLLDVPASYEAAVRRLGFEPDAEGFARYFAVESAHLERSYATFARCAQEMILQEAGEHTVPWEDTLALIARLMAEHAIRWWLVGSVALAARGLDVQPGDVDLVVDEEGSAGLTEALLDSLVEPIRPSTTWSAKVDGGRSWGRASNGQAESLRAIPGAPRDHGRPSPGRATTCACHHSLISWSMQNGTTDQNVLP